MYLVQILLPVTDNAGAPFPARFFSAVGTELTARFGGLTAFVDAPAEGLWQEDSASVRRDRVVLFEVMTEALDRAFWSRYRERLEQQFRQRAIVVRVQTIELL